MTGWAIGFVAGGIVVLVVVVLLLLMIVGVRRVAGKAEEVLAALRDASTNTQGLWAVADTNATASRIVAAATSVREGMETREVTR